MNVAAQGPSTRRRFLACSGLTATGLAATLMPVVGTKAAASSSPELSLRRRRNYIALVEAVASSPGTLAEASEAQRAARVLARCYKTGHGELKRRVDVVLHGLDEGLSVSFAGLAHRQRFDHLAAALDPGESDGTIARPSSSVVRDAVALAAAPFHVDGFRWEPAGADLWIRVARARRTRSGDH